MYSTPEMSPVPNNESKLVTFVPKPLTEKRMKLRIKSITFNPF